MKDFRRSILQALVSSQIIKNKIIVGSDTIATNRLKPFMPQKIREAESAHQP